MMLLIEGFGIVVIPEQEFEPRAFCGQREQDEDEILRELEREEAGE